MTSPTSAGEMPVQDAGADAGAGTGGTGADAGISAGVGAGVGVDAGVGVGAAAGDEFVVRPATLEEWREVAQWAADESWNPGLVDTDCFHATDPDGFFVGLLDGRLVSSVSVVNYSAAYAFLGYYLVHPDFRGRGLGLATWRAAMPHAGGRTVGLDAVPAQEATYRRSGFRTAYRTTRYRGRPVRSGTASVPVVPMGAGHLDEVAAFDRQCFPADRRGFLSRWLTAAGHHAYVQVRDGRVAGYGVIRPGREGWRVGPLFADTSRGAAALFDALVAHPGPDDVVYVDVPDPHHSARSMVLGRGMVADSHTMRMYTGVVPSVRWEWGYAVTSLELG
ncbi:GNAT family N-acetyltransferase [Streptomyces sp. NPDC018045]|uniref:GNAT family N-acetyltransferase n=1 Tax=Streptomyces sp. NPDC018045 TaxID=3365037 RepID=UPI0037AEDAAB